MTKGTCKEVREQMRGERGGKARHYTDDETPAAILGFAFGGIRTTSGFLDFNLNRACTIPSNIGQISSEVLPAMETSLAGVRVS